MKTKNCLLGIAALIIPVLAIAQSNPGPAINRVDGSKITRSEVDSTVAKLMQAAEVPGVGLALFNNGQATYLKAYGIRDKERNLPLTVDSAMTGASLSKVAFAYLVLRLADERVVNLDKPVSEYLPKTLPEYTTYGDLAGDERYKRITTRMLLSHTAGFANWRWFEDDRKLKIHFEPGTRFAYSGEGIDLLQLVVETVTREPLEKLMQDYVFQPLGMTRSSMVWQPRFEDDYAMGYDEYGRSLGAEKRSKPDAAGSLLTTPRDFALFLQAVMQGKGLSKQMHQQMLSPQIKILSKHEFPTLSDDVTEQDKPIRLSYGLAWGLYWTPYGEAFFKEGHDDGWRNYAVGFSKSGDGMLIMTNSGNGEGIYKALLEKVLGNSYTPIEWEGFTPYDQLPPRPALAQHKQAAVDPKIFQEYLGRYGNPPNLILVVRQEGDHLSVQENEEPKEEIFPESEKDFFSKTADDIFTFETDDSGRVIRMTLHTGGDNIPLNRIE
jgi:CubicO group peptidase (beta-lactamase class C family)